MVSRLEKAGSRFKATKAPKRASQGTSQPQPQPQSQSQQGDNGAGSSSSVQQQVHASPSKDPASLLPPGSANADDVVAPPHQAAPSTVAAPRPRPSPSSDLDGGIAAPAPPQRPPTISASLATRPPAISRASAGPSRVTAVQQAGTSIGAPGAALQRMRAGPSFSTQNARPTTLPSTKGSGVSMGNLRPPGADSTMRARSQSRALSRTPAPDLSDPDRPAAEISSSTAAPSTSSRERNSATPSVRPPRDTTSPTASRPLPPRVATSSEASQARPPRVTTSPEMSRGTSAGSRPGTAKSAMAPPSISAGPTPRATHPSQPSAASAAAGPSRISPGAALRSGHASRSSEAPEDDEAEQMAASSLAMMAMGERQPRQGTDNAESSSSSEDDAPLRQQRGQEKASRTKTGKSQRGNRLKKPLSAFLLYSLEARARLREEEPDATLSFAESGKRIGEQWKALPEAEKAVWHAKAADAREAYHQALIDRETNSAGEDGSNSSDMNGGSSVKKRTPAPHKPRRPQSAYLLWINEVRPARQAASPAMPMTQLVSKLAEEWRNMPVAEKSKVQARAQDLREEYRKDMIQWRKDYPEEVDEDDRPKRRTSSNPEGRRRRGPLADAIELVSDEEREWEEWIKEHDEDASRPDPNTISIDSIASISYRNGRPSAKTFQSARVYRHVKALDEAGNSRFPLPQLQKAETDRRAAREADEEEEEVVGDVDDVDELPTSGRGRSRSHDGSDYDEDDEEDDEDDDRRSAAGSTAASEASHVFQRNKNAPKTRIIDGKLVIDEASLQIDRNARAEDFDASEVIEEHDDHVFSNSRSYRPRQKSTRWSELETMKFLNAVAMWGTDFELISKMFPNRDRREIKAKWRREERSRPQQLHEMFDLRTPISAVEYGQQVQEAAEAAAKATALRTGKEIEKPEVFDFSGPVPVIEAKPPPAMDPGSGDEDDDASVNRSRTLASRSAEPQSDTDWEEEEVVEIGEDGEEIVTTQRVRKHPRKRGKKARPAPASKRARRSESRERSQPRDHAHRGDVIARRRAEAANEPPEEIIGEIE